MHSDIFCFIPFHLIFERAIKVMGYGLLLENLNFHHPIFKKQQWLKTLGADVWFWIPAPAPPSSVILSKFPIFFVIQPPHLQNEDNNRTCFLGSLWERVVTHVILVKLASKSPAHDKHAIHIITIIIAINHSPGVFWICVQPWHQALSGVPRTHCSPLVFYLIDKV